MKQPKKCWAWTAKQRGRQHLYQSAKYRRQQPAHWFVRYEWNRHRTYTSQALHQLFYGADEANMQLRYQHKYNAHWIQL